MSLSGPIQCTICGVQADQRRALIRQGWISIIATASWGRSTGRFLGRACPIHRDALLARVHEFFSKAQEASR